MIVLQPKNLEVGVTLVLFNVGLWHENLSEKYSQRNFRHRLCFRSRVATKFIAVKNRTNV